MKSDFRDLNVWKKGKELRIQIYDRVKTFPTEEKYRLADQMVRASRLFTNNISEGYGRFHYKDNIRFCNQARGSIYELIDHTEIAYECEFIDEEEFSNLNSRSLELAALTNGYIKYLRDKHSNIPNN